MTVRREYTDTELEMFSRHSFLTPDTLGALSDLARELLALRARVAELEGIVFSEAVQNALEQEREDERIRKFYSGRRVTVPVGESGATKICRPCLNPECAGMMESYDEILFVCPDCKYKCVVFAAREGGK